MADVNKIAAMVFGAAFVLVGVLGFVQDPILDRFETSLVHNVVHLLSGAALLALGFVAGGRHARMGMLVLGGVYSVVAVYGFFAHGAEGIVNTILGGSATDPALNDATGYLHVALSALLLGVPLIFKDDGPEAVPAAQA